jgi:Leucine-rich repeat (LRR) protein
MKIIRFRHAAVAKMPLAGSLALLVLAFSFWGASRKLIAAPPVDSISSVDAGEKALTRLKELGARVVEMNINGRWFSVDFDENWHGVDADFKLLDDLALLGDVSAEFDLEYIPPQTVSKLKLQTPLKTLHLTFEGQSAFQKVTAFPACREIRVLDWEGTPEDYRHFAVIAAGVESLTLRAAESTDGSRDRVSDDDIAELTGLTRLKELSIGYSRMTDAGLNSLSRMERLERLGLGGCHGLDGASLDALANFPALRQLDLGPSVSAAGLANIGKVAALEELEFSMSNMDPADAEPLSHLTRLKSLRIRWPRVSGESDEPAPVDDAALVPLGSALARATAAMPDLRRISLDLPTDEKGLAAIAAHDKLEDVFIDRCEVNDQSLAILSNSLGLTKLTLGGEGKVSDQGLAPLATLTKLAHLQIPTAGLTDSAFAHLAGLTAIESLTLQGSKITGARLGVFCPLTRLSYLNLAGSLFDDDACRLLPQFPKLQFLDLSHTKITDAGLNSIAKISALRSLEVNDTAITDHGFAKLAGHKTRSSIEAQNTSVTEEAVAKLQEALPEPPQGKFGSLWIRIGDPQHTMVFMSGKTGGEKAADSEQSPADDTTAEQASAADKGSAAR